MDRNFIRRHFENSDFNPVQANGLAQILDQMATKDDLRLLRADLTGEMHEGFAQMRVEMHQGFAQLRTEMHQELATSRSESNKAVEQIRGDLARAMAEMQASTLRWVIALIIALSSIFTLLELVVG